MAGLSIFALKYPSLLQFDEARLEEPVIRHNLKTLYGVAKAPCDTYLRESLDDQDFLTPIRTAFSSIFHILQRSKDLTKWQFLDKHYLISVDGSGFFSSNTVHCSCCLEKVSGRGTENEITTYHHQMLVGSLVSPNMSQVVPIEFEPIVKTDGATKNDCERTCFGRWLTLFRTSHPQLKTIILGDGLYSNGPCIKALKDHRCSFILGAKPGDHKYLYDYFFALEGEDIQTFETDTRGHKRTYRFANGVPLNETHHDLLVNVLYLEELSKKTGKLAKWLWVTDLEITRDNAINIMKGARARWKIENETFNTLKNQGYQFEHNFGHGKKGLSNVFAGLMLLAFCIDQILEGFNTQFQALKEKKKSLISLHKYLWAWFTMCRLSSYERLYDVCLTGPPEDWGCL